MLNFNDYVFKVVPRFLLLVLKKDTYLFFQVSSVFFIPFILFMRDHLNCQFKSVVDLVCLDLLEGSFRFELNYVLLSYKECVRCVVRVSIDNSCLFYSLVHVYKSIGWYEREVWDLFGVYFEGNFDLRRILTDYGFDGFPLRKDFPVVGFLEVRYEDTSKRIVCDFLDTSQEFRFFNFNFF